MSQAHAPYRLTLERLIDAPPEQVYRAWTDPELLCQWFTPRPWTVASAELDVRPGGSSLVVMRSPEGQDFPNRGVYLEVQPGRRLVFTDAYTEAWLPSAKPFMTVTLEFQPRDGKTHYRADVLHWTEADLREHEAMGFASGWGQATDQLEDLLAGLGGGA
ncbi:polyketide cyclase [Chromobacterium sp. Panama]|uniref:SRPBCC family protein n=1 Tax=Chromobacterium sp. Panama TaxID=2161826 RepID=UPI000D31D4CA|nr:SRPBCC family protein [Chromobacterium sp. Panama]PTU64031.1 polyketide cyclase [Chromobacterium sp. Panama]